MLGFLSTCANAITTSRSLHMMDFTHYMICLVDRCRFCCKMWILSYQFLQRFDKLKVSHGLALSLRFPWPDHQDTMANSCLRGIRIYPPVSLSPWSPLVATFIAHGITRFGTYADIHSSGARWANQASIRGSIFTDENLIFITSVNIKTRIPPGSWSVLRIPIIEIRGHVFMLVSATQQMLVCGKVHWRHRLGFLCCTAQNRGAAKDRAPRGGLG
jgi:hypothetical protein